MSQYFSRFKYINLIFESIIGSLFFTVSILVFKCCDISIHSNLQLETIYHYLFYYKKICYLKVIYIVNQIIF